MESINFRCLESPEIRKAAEGEGRKMTFVASDGTRDSAGTVLNVDGWDLKRFNNNGVIGYQHKVYGGWDDTDNPDNIIGKGHAYVETDSKGVKRLMVDVEFEPEGLNDLADKVYKKLEFGTLKAVSVGFRPVGKGAFGQGEEARGGSNETYYYAGQELLEVSVVNIPANPNALRTRNLEEAQKELEALRAQEEPQDPTEEPKAPEVEDPIEETNEETDRADEVEARKAAIEKAVTIARATLLS